MEPQEPQQDPPRAMSIRELAPDLLDYLRRNSLEGLNRTLARGGIRTLEELFLRTKAELHDLGIPERFAKKIREDFVLEHSPVAVAMEPQEFQQDPPEAISIHEQAPDLLEYLRRNRLEGLNHTLARGGIRTLGELFLRTKAELHNLGVPLRFAKKIREDFVLKHSVLRRLYLAGLEEYCNRFYKEAFKTAEDARHLDNEVVYKCGVAVQHIERVLDLLAGRKTYAVLLAYGPDFEPAQQLVDSLWDHYQYHLVCDATQLEEELGHNGRELEERIRISKSVVSLFTRRYVEEGDFCWLWPCLAYKWGIPQGPFMCDHELANIDVDNIVRRMHQANSGRWKCQSEVDFRKGIERLAQLRRRTAPNDLETLKRKVISCVEKLHCQGTALKHNESCFGPASDAYDTKSQEHHNLSRKTWAFERCFPV